MTGVASIGVGKTYYSIPAVTKYTRGHANNDLPLFQKGDWVRLGDVEAAALKSSDNAKNPIFISVGHRVSLKTAIEVVLECSKGFRVPEPIRAADHLTRTVLKETTQLATLG